jgi:hypothetical protein
MRDVTRYVSVLLHRFTIGPWSLRSQEASSVSPHASLLARYRLTWRMNAVYNAFGLYSTVFMGNNGVHPYLLAT